MLPVNVYSVSSLITLPDANVQVPIADNSMCFINSLAGQVNKATKSSCGSTNVLCLCQVNMDFRQR